MQKLSGVGLGFRHDIADNILVLDSQEIDFIEIAPENYMNMGGYWLDKLKQVAQKYPMTNHGLSLSIGSPNPLDWTFLRQLKNFLSQFNVQVFSEHLSFSHSSNAHLFELLPIPFRKDAVNHVSDRIKVVQDFLEMPIAIENVSYYLSIEPQMSEADFINEILDKSGCRLLLDVNNVYVNAFNHRYDPYQFINSLSLDKVQYIHMAGHEQVDENFIIDTHGEDIVDPVYNLFDYVTQKIDSVPVLLERDYNFKDFKKIIDEVGRLKNIINSNWSVEHVDKAYATPS